MILIIFPINAFVHILLHLFLDEVFVIPDNSCSGSYHAGVISTFILDIHIISRSFFKLCYNIF